MQYRSFASWDGDIVLNQSHRITRQRISGGNQRSIIQPVGFCCFRCQLFTGCSRARELIAKMNDVAPRLRDGIVIMSCTRRKVIS